MDRSKTFTVGKLLVHTGSEYTWVPSSELENIGVAREKRDLTFVMANGQHITRSVGFAIVRVGEHFTVDEVVFAQTGDLLLLGARSLEGLNLSLWIPLGRSWWPPDRCLRHKSVRILPLG